MTDVPVFSECVIGYRSWDLADWVLSPITVGSPWRPGVNHARCQANPYLLTSTGRVAPGDHVARAPKHIDPKGNRP